MKYKVLETNTAENYMMVEFLNPKWDKSLVLSEKRKIVETDDSGKTVSRTVTEKVDQNHHRHHVHRVTMPAVVEGEDYETVTLVRRIEEVGRGVLHKMDIKAVQNQKSETDH